MWQQLLQHLAQCDTVVVTGLDAEGYPFSVRCKPEPLADQQALRVALPESAAIQPGPASLMSHTYDENTWNQTSFMVRGDLEAGSDGWIFRPTKLIPGFSRNPFKMMQLLMSSRRNTRQYLEKRHLPRPRVNWDDVRALWREVESQSPRR